MRKLFILLMLSSSVAAVAKQGFVPDTLGAAQALSHNPAELLKGEISGVRVSSASGSPTAPVAVDVRGLSTLRGDNQPLWIVDGAMMENASGTNLNPFWNYPEVGKVQAFNTLFHINPYDIESIEVLKDASATALYGSRGAAGVIIVRTKMNRKTERDIAIRGNLSLEGENLSHNWYVNMSGLKSKTSYNISATFRNSNLACQGYKTNDFNVKANMETRESKIFWFGANAIVGMGNIDMNGNLYEDYLDNAKQYAATASAWVRLNFGPFVNWHTTAGADYRSSNRNTWYGPGNNVGSYMNGLAGLASNISVAYNVRSEVTFSRYFSEVHKLSASAGVDFYGGSGDYTSLSAGDFFSYELAARGISFSNSTRPPYVYADHHRHLGFFARVGYAFNDIAGIDGTFRAEKTLTQPVGAYNIYPAGSAWVDISNLAFRDSKAVSTLRIEGGYGISGNEKSILYPFFDNIIDMTYEPEAGEEKMMIDGRSYQNLTEWHAGGQLGFISDRIVLEGTYFDRKIEDTFTQYKRGEYYRGRSSNFTSRGVEAAISVVPVRRRNFTWTIKANGTLVETQLLGVDSRDAFFDPGYAGSGFFAANMVGRGIGTIIGYKVGPNGSYLDIVPDGVINKADCVELGNLIPKVYGGVGTTLRFREFTLDLHGDFAAGFSAIDGSLMKSEGRSVLTSRYVSKGDYFSLSRVAFNYDIPMKGNTVKGLSVTLSGHNLVTFTGFSGSNPEASAFGFNPLARGVDYCTCPLVPAVVLGAQIKF